MSWLLSIAIGLLAAVGGLFAAIAVSSACVSWYRISSFEGASGYFVVAMGLLGALAALIIGIICSRVVAGWPSPGFLKGLGVAYGTITSISLVAALICWLLADIPPTRDGQNLELIVEVRCPRGAEIPQPVEPYRATAFVYSINGANQPSGELQLTEAKLVDEQWVIPVTVPLLTAVRQKWLRIHFNDQHDFTFGLFRTSKPRPATEQWSPWLKSGWNANEAEPSAEKSYFMRYRVQVKPPPPPTPSVAEIEAEAAAKDRAAFEAVPADAPITTWFTYTKYGTAPERIQTAVNHITARPNYVEELSALFASTDLTTSMDALYVVQHLNAPPVELVPAVKEVGRSIADAIQTFSGVTPEQDPSYQGAADISLRFSAWMVAVRTLHEKCGADFTEQIVAILERARLRPDSHALRQDVVRVSSYYAHEWAGIAPLASDPPPR